MRKFDDLNFVNSTFIRVTELPYTTDILKVLAIKMGQSKRDEAIALRDLYYYPKMRDKEQIKEIKI